MLERHPTTWKWQTLEEISEINPRYSAKSVSENTEVSFVPMAAVSEITASITNMETRPLSEVRKGFTPFQEGDVIFAKITPCMENGKVAIARNLTNGLAFGSTEFHVIRPFPGISNRWIWYFLRNPATREHAAQNMTGSAGQRRVPTDFMRMLQIPLPSTVAQQEHIADLLDEVDAARRICAQLQEEIESFIAALFMEMFGDPEKNPKGWPAVKLDQYAEVVGGVQVTAKRISGQSVPYLRVANVYRNHLNLTEVKSILVSLNELESKSLQVGDVLIVEGHGNPGELGRAAVWDGTIAPCIHQNHLIRARPYRDSLTAEYLSYLINSSYGKNYFLRVGKTTSGLNTISTSVVKNFPLILPPSKLQNDFINIVHNYEECYRIHMEMADALEAQLSSIMAYIFGGTVSSEDYNKVDNHVLDRATNRIIWPKLSVTQQHLWEASQTFTDSFKAEELSEKVHEQQGKVLSSEYVQSSMELFEVLAVTIKEDRSGLEKWRLPNDEADADLEV